MMASYGKAFPLWFPARMTGPRAGMRSAPWMSGRNQTSSIGPSALVTIDRAHSGSNGSWAIPDGGAE